MLESAQREGSKKYRICKGLGMKLYCTNIDACGSVKKIEKEEVRKVMFEEPYVYCTDCGDVAIYLPGEVDAKQVIALLDNAKR